MRNKLRVGAVVVLLLAVGALTLPASAGAQGVSSARRHGKIPHRRAAPGGTGRYRTAYGVISVRVSPGAFHDLTRRVGKVSRL
jgi:hypothetical protein